MTTLNIPVTDKAYRNCLASIFVVALALRIAITATFQGLNSPPDCDSSPDQCQYEEFAYHLSRGEGYVLDVGGVTACRAPGTSLTLLPVYFLAGRSFTLARLWWCLISALACLATAWTGRLCFGRHVAIAAAGWLAVYPGAFYYALHFVSEAPFALYLALASGTTVAALQSRRDATAIGAGLMWGACALTRPQILPTLPLAWVVAIVLSRSSRWANLRLMVLITCGLAAACAPWVVRNAVVIGKPTMTTILGGYGFWYGNNEVVLNDPQFRGMCPLVEQLIDAEHPLRGSELEREAAAWRYGADFVKTHWSDMPRLCAMKLYRLLTPFEETSNRAAYWAFAVGWLAAAPFVVAGSVLAWRRAPQIAAVLLMPLVANLAVTVVFYGLIRYRDVYAATFLILAGLALVTLMGKRSEEQ